jgi:hypothetical protein
VPFRFTIDSPRKISGLFPVFALLGLIFTPTNFFFYSGHGASGQIKCLLLVGLMTIALIYPFSSEGAGALVETELVAAGQAATPGLNRVLSGSKSKIRGFFAIRPWSGSE